MRARTCVFLISTKTCSIFQRTGTWCNWRRLQFFPEKPSYCSDISCPVDLQLRKIWHSNALKTFTYNERQQTAYVLCIHGLQLCTCLDSGYVSSCWFFTTRTCWTNTIENIKNLLQKNQVWQRSILLLCEWPATHDHEVVADSGGPLAENRQDASLLWRALNELFSTWGTQNWSVTTWRDSNTKEAQQEESLCRDDLRPFLMTERAQESMETVGELKLRTKKYEKWWNLGDVKLGDSQA